MEFILNDESLCGQFDNIGIFLDSLKENVRCFELINNVKENKIYKTERFYENKVTSIVDGLAAIAEENAASTEETSASMLEFNEILSVCNKATGELRKLSEELAENTKHFDL